MKSLVVAAVVSAYFFNGEDPRRMLETQYKSYITVQAFKPSSIEKYRKRILDSSRRLPKSAKRFIDANIDWEVYAESIFRPNWDELTKRQKTKFKSLLQRDAIERYGHLFSASTTFSAKFNGSTDYKLLRGERFAKVRTTLSSTRSDAEIDVDFISAVAQNDGPYVMYTSTVFQSLNHIEALYAKFIKKKDTKGSLKPFGRIRKEMMCKLIHYNPVRYTKNS